MKIHEFLIPLTYESSGCKIDDFSTIEQM